MDDLQWFIEKMGAKIQQYSVITSGDHELFLSRLTGESPAYRRGYAEALHDIEMIAFLTQNAAIADQMQRTLCKRYWLIKDYDNFDRKGVVAAKLRFVILKRDNFRCQLCGASRDNTPDMLLHVDHKIPRVKGGTNHEDNLWTLCALCNQGKGTDDL
jgi:predicted restriction endonuclease